jgi:hypothetical protein
MWEILRKSYCASGFVHLLGITLIQKVDSRTLLQISVTLRITGGGFNPGDSGNQKRAVQRNSV